MRLAQSSVVAGGLFAAADGVVLDAQALLPCACCVMCHTAALRSSNAVLVHIIALKAQLNAKALPNLQVILL